MGSDEEHEVVIGQQMADALAREHSHRAAWSGSTSPLSRVHYDWSKGECDLLRLREAPADARVESFLETAVGMTTDHLADVRGALTTDDFYTLITFARRSIVRALRGASASVIRRALAGIALVDAARLDPRDLSWVIALSAWGVQRLHVSRDDALRDALRIGTPSAVDALNRFLDDKIDLSDWGFTEVATASGAGLVQCEYAEYAPTSNLLDAALTLADALEADQYEPALLTVASNLPKVWFRNADEGRLTDSLGAVRATISISSKPRPGVDAHPERQMLLVFVSESANRKTAAWLAEAARGAAGESHHAVAAGNGPFFVTLVARSSFVGTASVETAESVTRFLPALHEALEMLAPADEPSNPPQVSRRWRRRRPE